MQWSSSKPAGIFNELVNPSSTLRAGIVGSLLCWLALPPLNLFWLVWIAPVPWLVLVKCETLPGRRPYWSLWLSGVVFWLLAVHWIRLPHPLNYLAWAALASYLGIYLPAFVVLARCAVHRYRVPLVIAAPVVWTGLEWIRGHLWTGFLMGSLAHTQYRVPVVIQIADLVGEYGVTFLIMFTAASLLSVALNILDPNEKSSWFVRFPRYFVLLTLPLAIIIAYAIISGAADLVQKSNSTTEGPRIALIQGNTPADWKMDDARQMEIMQEYSQVSRDAVAEAKKKDGRAVDLVVWPETAFRQNLISAQEGFTPPPERIHSTAMTAAITDLGELVKQVGCAVLVGIDRMLLIPDEANGMSYHAFNSAVFVDKVGRLTAIYDKMHPVVFGEYIPFADWFPFLYGLTPLTGGIVAGTQPTAVKLEDGTVIAPNICYETVVPHLIRNQLVALDKLGARPDALLNHTNDAWFWGSSELDMHLACGVFRAVETRTPLLVAANGGLSAHVDHLGNIRQVTPRQETAFLLVDLEKQERPLSFYTRWGDWFALVCVVCCLVLACAAIARRQVHPGDQV
jgi:apolipoprotein N-acyltransferase